MPQSVLGPSKPKFYSTKVKHDPTRAAYWITQRGTSYQAAIRLAQAERKKRGLPSLGHVLYGQDQGPGIAPVIPETKASKVMTKTFVAPKGEVVPTVSKWDNRKLINKYLPGGWTKLTKAELAKADQATSHRQLMDIAAQHQVVANRTKGTRIAGITVPRPDIAVKDVALTLAATPGAAVMAGKALYHDPIGFIKSLPEATYRQLKYDLSQEGWDKHPSGLLFDLFGAGALAKGGVLRSGAYVKALREGMTQREALNVARRAHIKSGTLKAGKTEVSVPLVKNPLLQPLSAARIARQDKVLAGGNVIKVPKLVPEKLTKEFTAAARTGRALRSFHTTQQRLRMLPADQAARSLKWVMSKTSTGKLKYNRVNDLAIAVRGIFGKEAITDPVGSVQKFVNFHQRALTELEKEKSIGGHNRAYLASLDRKIAEQQDYITSAPKILETLQTNSQKFQDAVMHTKALSRATEGELVRRGQLTPETAADRINRMYQRYQGSNLNLYRGYGRGIGPDVRVVNGPRYEDAIFATTSKRVAGSYGPKLEHLTLRQDAKVAHPTHQEVIDSGGPPGYFNKARKEGYDAIVYPDQDYVGTAILNEKAILRRGEGAPSPEDAFYFSVQKRYLNNPPGNVKAENIGRVAGPFGISRPQELPGLGKYFTGHEAGIPYVVETVVDRFNRTMKLSGTEDFFNDLYKAGHNLPEPGDIAIRNAGISDEFRAAVRDASIEIETDGAVSPGTAARMKDSLFPKKHQFEPSDPSIRYISPNLVKDITTVRGKNPALTVIDNINDVSRAATLYTRPAYLLNALGNAGMLMVTQGFMMPMRLYQAFHAEKLYGQHVVDVLKAGMGEGRSRAYMSPGKGRLHEVTQKMAMGWNKITDERFRIASAIHNADLEGFSGRKALEELTKFEGNTPVHARELNLIFQRANDDLVNFSNLTPFEKSVMQRIFYFHAWISRGTKWAVRSTYEHPAKTAVELQAGYRARDEIKKKLGDVLPGWVQESGIFPVTGGQKPMVINPASVWTPTTMTQTLGALVHGGANLGDTLTPGVGALRQAMSDKGYKGAISELLSLPQVTALERAGVHVPGATTPGGTYPGRGIAPAAGPLIAGGLYPREMDKAVIRKQGVKELPKARGAYVSVMETNKTSRLNSIARLKKLGYKGQLAPQVENAYGLYANGMAAAANSKGYKAKLEDTVKYLQTKKIVTPAEVHSFLKLVQGMDENKASKVLDKVRYNLMGGAIIRALNSALNEAESGG